MTITDNPELMDLVQNAPMGICILDAATLVSEVVNDAFLEVAGRPREDIVGHYYWDTFAEVRHIFEQDLIKATQGETIRGEELEIPLIRYGVKETVFINFVFAPVKNSAGRVTRVAVWVIENTSKVKHWQQMQPLKGELDATNEELAFSNEQLYKDLAIRIAERSDDHTVFNEELKTSNKKLQQTNDELESVNKKFSQTQTALQESENQLYFTLNAIPTQVWTATPKGALNYVNQVVCNDFGYTADEMVGHGWQKFIHPEDLDNCLKKWTAALLSGNEYAVEFRLKFKDDNYYWHLARALPFSEDGAIKLWLGTNTNIQSQKYNEQQKDEFLSIASHELKTPLTSIKLYNQLMVRSKNEEQLKAFAAKTTDHILRLERLISDLLDVTKINAGKMNYSMEPFDLGQMVADSVDIIRPLAGQSIIVEENVNVIFTGDKFRLEQVMDNFLSNAIKYSPGADRIIVKAVIEHESIIVSVQDFGIGIDRESIDRLFDRYYRVDNTAMRFQGLGLGLFISSEILKRHNGSFWIESEKNKGSTFYFRLPLATEKAPDPPVITDTTYDHETIKIIYLKDAGRIEADWRGFQDLCTVKAGCMAILEMVCRSRCNRIVNDNTHVLGNWSDAADWVGNEWFPMMEKAGVKYLAHIFSPSTFSQLAAQKSIDIMAGIVTTQYFTDIDLARKWVGSCK